ncbi:MTH1187 family thiamine-binding protein [Salipaludibacillus sp. CF4.18]|uniref:MTH1187 family thiamine-binding protein n=1 Tax=Salipaludibacillus sp. CF4.18 TaxID=3373081 RepID=UPI003EE4D2F0
MPLLEISVVPVGTQSESFSSDVEAAVSIIKKRGLSYQVTPTATIIEGDLDDIMDVAKEIHHNEIGNGAKRVVTNITIDDRIDKPISLDRQVDHVKNS